jgi:uncharacterized phiE125 gp8 family phage protein
VQVYQLELVTAPTQQPITLIDAKQHLRVDFDFHDDDAVILDCIAAATDYAEKVQGRQICTATWRMYLDCFPCEIGVPRSPLQSVSSIMYLDSAGDWQTLSSSLYVVDGVRLPGRIVPAYGQVWPVTRIGVPNVVKVTFVAGNAVADVSISTRRALLLLTTHFYESRDPVVGGSESGVPYTVPLAVEALLQIDRIVEFV